MLLGEREASDSYLLRRCRAESQVERPSKSVPGAQDLLAEGKGKELGERASSQV